MKWSWKIARYKGIDIAVHFTFPLLLVWVAFIYWQQTHSSAAVIEGLALILALFCCVVLHEFGHALTARRFGIRTRSITLLPIGGVAAMEGMPKDPRQEMLVAAAGPAVNLIIASLIWLLLLVAGPPPAGAVADVQAPSFLQQLLAINLILAVFNMLPAFPMDGGRVLRAALAMRMDRAEATRRAAAVGQFFAALMFVLGLFYNPFLILIAAFVWLGAAAESSAEVMHSALFKATAGQAMITRFEQLAPGDRLQTAVDLTLSSTQKHFPVTAPGEAMHLLTQSDLLRGLHEAGQDARLGALELQALPCIDRSTSMESIFQRLQDLTTPLLGVTDEGRLVGVIDLENVLELINIEAAIKAHRRQQGSRLM